MDAPSRPPVRITVAGAMPGAQVHALVNASRIGCYVPFTDATPVTPAEMAEMGLTVCRYCWPAGIIWPPDTSMVVTA